MRSLQEIDKDIQELRANHCITTNPDNPSEVLIAGKSYPLGTAQDFYMVTSTDGYKNNLEYIITDEKFYKQKFDPHYATQRVNAFIVKSNNGRYALLYKGQEFLSVNSGFGFFRSKMKTLVKEKALVLGLLPEEIEFLEKG